MSQQRIRRSSLIEDLSPAGSPVALADHAALGVAGGAGKPANWPPIHLPTSGSSRSGGDGRDAGLIDDSYEAD